MNNNERFALRIVLIVTVFILAGVGYLLYSYNSSSRVSNFEECKSAGHPVMETYPEQCIANGRTFIQD